MLTMSSPSPVHTPLALGMGGEVQGVQESMATMSSVQRQVAVAAAAAAHNGALDQMELAARMAVSPGKQNG
jgi:hypothetical protein